MFSSISSPNPSTYLGIHLCPTPIVGSSNQFLMRKTKISNNSLDQVDIDKGL
jgi:hypothetical protein